VTSTGSGSTSFEPDADPMDGWTAPAAPTGSPGNDNTWELAGVADLPPSTGAVVRASLDREGEVLHFLAGTFGRYPFRASGGIVDDIEGFSFALENQTRPIYSKGFFSDPQSGTAVVVHELAHQWYGDSLAVRRWRDIWLNEGFATYAEWLWSQHEGAESPQQIFDLAYAGIPGDDDFWKLRIGDPGPGHMFDRPVYTRGAMTLQQLRVAVGDTDFFRILRRWARVHRGGNVSTGQFVGLAERISGKQLDGLFRQWLYTAGKPVVTPAPARQAPASEPESVQHPPYVDLRKLLRGR
jgi:hypothetical protein